MQKVILLSEEEYSEITNAQVEAYDYTSTTDVIERLANEKNCIQHNFNELSKVASEQSQRITKLEGENLELKAEVNKGLLENKLTITEEEIKALANVFNCAIKFMRMKTTVFKENDINQVQELFLKIQNKAK